MNIARKIGLLGLFTVIILLNFTVASDWNLPGVTIISRSERGADESIRFKKSQTTISSSTSKTTSNSSTTSTSQSTQSKGINYSQIRNNWMSKHYPYERKYEGSNTIFGDKYLSYPEYFNHHKNKIVIHHTATDYDPNRSKEDVESYLRKIYKYHTIDRKFGDIGYNFLIDQLGNIYEGRAGGEGAVGMHASNNNVSSIGIALFGNFENDVPTEAQLSALINLTTAIAKYYNIDPQGKTHTFEINTSKEPYVTEKENYNIMGHENIKATACPGKNLYIFLPKLRDEVDFRLKNGIVGDIPLPSSWLKILEGEKISLQLLTVNSGTNTVTKTETNDTSSNISFLERFIKSQKENPKIFKHAGEELKNRYEGNITKASTSMEKIVRKYSIDDVKDLVNKDISVLLYELTTKYDSFDIKCEGKCIFTIDGVDYNWTGATLTFLSNKIRVKSDFELFANYVSVKSTIDNGVVEVTNYNRKSYVGIPWNTFKGKLKFEKGIYPLKNGEQKSDFIVVNTLSFSEYMKGIVETNDTETLEKNKVMAMISKNYALFYLNKENFHPNISEIADYTAIDDPDFFQKYVGAGLERTLTKWYQALNATKNQIVMYNNYLPILPYFSCSAGFTLSAEDKRGWNDTPYLQSTYDFDSCDKFSGHGVGLAGKGAERLAKQGVTYDQILKYYYDGIEIKNIN